MNFILITNVMHSKRTSTVCINDQTIPLKVNGRIPRPLLLSSGLHVAENKYKSFMSSTMWPYKILCCWTHSHATFNPGGQDKEVFLCQKTDCKLYIAVFYMWKGIWLIIWVWQTVCLYVCLQTNQITIRCNNESAGILTRAYAHVHI